MVLYDYRTATYEGYTPEEILAIAQVSIDDARAQVLSWAEDVSAGDLSMAEFRSRMEDEVDNQHIILFLLGIGGLAIMASADWEALGNLIGIQRDYLADYLAAAPTLTPARLAQRGQMYMSAAGGSYEDAFQRAIMRSGAYTEERWITTAGESCPDCIGYQSLGWVSLGTIPAVPRDGSTQCRVNCKCYKSYR